MRKTARFPRDGSGSAVETDALIIGSGFGGAAPALRLAEAGLRVQVVERGQRFGPADFRQTQDPNYLRRHIRGVGNGDIGLTYAQAYGGASPFYEMVSLRAPSATFDQLDGHGRRLWPTQIDRATLDPYYELAEQTLRVRQIKPDRIPKTGQVFAMLMRSLGHECSRMPMAIGACLGAGSCVTGCVYGAKRDLSRNYLPKAERAGAVVRTGWTAREIRPLNDPGAVAHDGTIESVPYRYEVTCVRPNSDDADSHWRLRFRTKLLILASGTIGTAALLLRSAERLPHMSRHVGRNIGFNSSSKVLALLPESLPDVDNFTGPSIPGVVSYSLLRSHGLTLFPAKPLPLQMIAAARFRVRGPDGPGEYWGPDNVAFMRQYRRRALLLAGLGVNPPVAELRCRPGKGAEADKIEVRVQSEPALRQMQARRHDDKQQLRGLLERAGCTIVDIEYIGLDGSPRDDRHFSSAHHIGSCRMGDSPDAGAVDEHGEMFGHPGIYVTDGAAVPACPGVNPSLTILANAERVSDTLLDRYARGEAS